MVWARKDLQRKRSGHDHHRVTFVFRPFSGLLADVKARLEARR